MSISVNTSRSALNALQTLAKGNDPAAAAQARTGSAARPGQERRAGETVQAPRADVVSLAQAKRALDRAASISDVALGAGQTISDILDQLRAEADQAGGDDGGRARSVAARLEAAVKQIGQAAERASFDGVNLLNGSLDQDLRVALDGGSEIKLAARDLRPGGPFVTLGADTDEGSVLARLESSRINVSSALADLRIQGRQVEAHSRFVSRFGEALVTEQADGDLSKDSARLMALQVQQQLAGERMAIANQAPQMVLQLFRS